MLLSRESGERDPQKAVARVGPAMRLGWSRATRSRADVRGQGRMGVCRDQVVCVCFNFFKKKKEKALRLIGCTLECVLLGSFF